MDVYYFLETVYWCKLQPLVNPNGGCRHNPISLFFYLQKQQAKSPSLKALTQASAEKGEINT